jgi:hypothetical protein
MIRTAEEGKLRYLCATRLNWRPQIAMCRNVGVCGQRRESQSWARSAPANRLHKRNLGGTMSSSPITLK